MPSFLLLLLLLALSPAANASLPRAPLAHPASFLVSAAHRDVLRHRRTAETISRHRRREACEVPRGSHNASFSMRLIAGAYTGTGQYFASFLVGTPSQRFHLVLDTGSDLTWVKCRSNATAGSGGRVFRPGESSTFRPISCSSSLCKSSLPFSLTSCPSDASPCLYEYGYSDGSKALGLFAKESATLRLSSTRRAKLPGIVLGCTSSFQGTSFRAADGVLGLAYSSTSFAARAAGGRFAYCLVDHLSPKNATGFVAFGPRGGSRPRLLRHAALVVDQLLEPFYGVQIRGLSLGGERLDIPRAVWNASAGGGAILDTGTSLTLLAEPAYRKAAAALSRALSEYPRVELKPFEFCYNWTAAGGFEEARVPRLAVHMAGYGDGGEVRLEPPVKSYIVDVADGVKCIGLLPAAWPGLSTMGNIIQQEHYWEFDVGSGRFAFAPSSC